MGVWGSGQRSFCAIFFVALFKLQFSSAVRSLFRHFFPRALHIRRKKCMKSAKMAQLLYIFFLFFIFYFLLLRCMAKKKTEVDEEKQNKSDRRTGIQSFQHFSHSVSESFACFPLGQGDSVDQQRGKLSLKSRKLSKYEPLWFLR